MAKAKIGRLINLNAKFKVTPQSGMRKSIKRDRRRLALPPGKRISINGKVYWETRKNRTDRLGTTL